MPYFSRVPQVISIIFMRKVHEDFFFKETLFETKLLKACLQMPVQHIFFIATYQPYGSQH